MRKRFYQIAILLILVQFTALFAGAFIVYFHARSEGDNVVLTWQTGSEQNLSKFLIERKTVNGSFTELSSILPKGNNNTYTFTDETAFKVTDAIYIYRIKIVDNDNSSTFSSEVSVSHNVSSVKRTWGSIKALFR